MKSILSPEFKYVPAAKCDIRKTIKRERERLKREADKPTAEVITPASWLARKIAT